MLFLFPWKARLKLTQAIKFVRAKFVVTGELAVLKHLKAAALGNAVTSHLSLIFHSYQCRRPLHFALADGVVGSRVLNLITNETSKKITLHDVNLLRYLCDKSQVKKIKFIE